MVNVYMEARYVHAWRDVYMHGATADVPGGAVHAARANR